MHPAHTSARRPRSQRSIIHWSTVVVGACATLMASSSSLAVDIPIAPKRTYLHASSSDSADATVPIDLAAIGVLPGDRIAITQLGEYDNGPGADVFTTMIAVFSGSATLLPQANLHRVVDAIDAGVDFVSAATYFGGEPTDIPEDFVVNSALFPSGSICITVPAGATHLFVAPHDSLYEDNSDPDADYAVRIEHLADCAADLDRSGSVDGADLGIVLASWGAAEIIGGPGDLDCNGIVDGADLGLMLSAWGSCP